METALTIAESRQVILNARCEKLLELYNPGVIHKTFSSVKTATDCIALQEQGEPVLLSIARRSEAEHKKLVATIKLNIIALDKFLHLKNSLTEDETDFIAEQIVDEFGGSLTFADLHLVFKKGKAGTYGKMYERLSAPDVLDWFRQYFNNRLDVAERYNYNKSCGGKVAAANLLTAIKSDSELYQGMKKIIGEPVRVSREEIEKEYQAYKRQIIENNYKPIADDTDHE